MIDKIRRTPGYLWRNRRTIKAVYKYVGRQIHAHAKLVVFAIFGVIMLRIWWDSWLYALVPHAFVFLIAHLRWKWNYLKKIKAEGADDPGRVELIKAWWMETEKLDQGIKGWHDACVAFGLTPPNARPVKNKPIVTPKLLDPIVDLDGDITSPIASGRVFVPIAKIIKAAPDIAEAIPRCREIVVTPDHNDPGCGTVKMYWSNPLARTIKIKNLPYGKNYSDAVCGRTLSGAAASASWEAGPVWIVGITGSGKSGLIWNIIADLRDRDVPFKIAVSDPKGGMEMKKLRKSPRVTHFAKNPAETVQLVNDMVAEMRRRQPLIENRKLTVPTDEFPLYLIPLDEIITCMPLLMAQGQTRGANAQQAPIVQLLNECRSALMWPVLCSQTGHASIVGDNRNLIPTRILLRVGSAATIGTVIDGWQERGVRAHELHPIHDRGIGWIENEHGHLEKFRAALITEAEIDRLAADLKIKGMGRESRSGVKKPKKDTYVYHAKSYDKIENGVIVPFNRHEYDGVSNNPKLRFEQHRRDDWAFCKEHGQWENWWVQHVDESKMIIEGPFTRDEALRRERESITDTMPVWNEVHNWDNPVAKTWGKVANRFPTRKTRASRGTTSEPSNDQLTWDNDDTIEFPAYPADLDREAAELIDSELVPAVVVVEGEVEDPAVPDGPPPKVGRIRSRTPLPPIAPMMILFACALASIASGIGLS